MLRKAEMSIFPFKKKFDFFAKSTISSDFRNIKFINNLLVNLK